MRFLLISQAQLVGFIPLSPAQNGTPILFISAMLILTPVITIVSLVLNVLQITLFHQLLPNVLPFEIRRSYQTAGQNSPSSRI